VNQLDVLPGLPGSEQVTLDGHVCWRVDVSMHYALRCCDVIEAGVLDDLTHRQQGRTGV